MIATPRPLEHRWIVQQQLQRRPLCSTNDSRRATNGERHGHSSFRTLSPTLGSAPSARPSAVHCIAPHCLAFHRLPALQIHLQTSRPFQATFRSTECFCRRGAVSRQEDPPGAQDPNPWYPPYLLTGYALCCDDSRVPSGPQPRNRSHPQHFPRHAKMINCHSPSKSAQRQATWARRRSTT